MKLVAFSFTGSASQFNYTAHEVSCSISHSINKGTDYMKHKPDIIHTYIISKETALKDEKKYYSGKRHSKGKTPAFTRIRID